MESGLIVDLGHMDHKRQNKWVKGSMAPASFLGFKYEIMPDGTTKPVRTLRCTGCGYLESYAT